MRQIAHVAFGVVLVVCAGGRGAPAGRPSEDEPAAAGGVALRPVGADDFQCDSRDQYEVEGDVVWDPGRLTFASGASLTRTIDGGADVEVELTLALPAPEEGQPSEARLRLSFDSTRRACALWALLPPGGP